MAPEVESLNFSSLIEAELGFADFYMDYKHNIKKEIHLDMEVPYITGITAFYSIALWMLIREAAKNAQKQDETFRITTVSDDQWVIVTISHIGDSLVPGWQEILSPVNDDPDPLAYGADEEKNLICALMLFRLAGGRVEMTHDGDHNLLTIRIQHHQ